MALGGFCNERLAVVGNLPEWHSEIAIRHRDSWFMALRDKLLVLAVAAIPTAFNCSPALARHRAAYRYCDPETGDAVRPDIQALNRLKNREAAPTAKDFDRTVSLAAMLRPGDDRSRWNDHKAAQVVGYVADAKMGGVETVNCHARSVHGRDTHIDLTLSAADEDKEPVLSSFVFGARSHGVTKVCRSPSDGRRCQSHALESCWPIPNKRAGCPRPFATIKTRAAERWAAA